MRPARTRMPLASSLLLGLGGALTLAALPSCHTAELAPERALPESPQAGQVLVWSAGAGKYVPASSQDYPIELRSYGCVTCHVGQQEPHPGTSLEGAIGCTDCHGGVGWVSTRSLAQLLEPDALPAWLKTVGVTDVSSAAIAARHPKQGFVQVADFEAAQRAAHVHFPTPETEERWRERRGGAALSSGNPEAAYGLQLREDWEYVRFVNPGDLRVAALGCGTAGCHPDTVIKVQRSMMATAPMLWGAALYNNGAYPLKPARFGESYDPHGQPQSVLAELPQDPAARAEAQLGRGELERLDPLPRFEIGQPSNILRIFERGQKRPLLIGLPTPGSPGAGLDEEPGRPQNRLSQRGLGTLNRTDPVWLNLQRTRLMDPTLNMMGTNDQPGDFRASGCTACHMVYANDRDPLNELRAACWGTRDEDRKYARFAHHQGPYAYSLTGGAGKTRVLVPGGRDADDPDARLPADEPGHPIRHELTNRIPSAQCVTCHMHPGTAVEQSYLGYMWWDLEADGAKLWPKQQIDPSQALELAAMSHNPEGSTAKRIPPLPQDLDAKQRAALLAEAGGDEARARDLYYRRELLGKKLGSQELNAELADMQLGDFKGHGFLFRAVFERDDQGKLRRKRPLLVLREAADGPARVLVRGPRVARPDGAADAIYVRMDEQLREVFLEPGPLREALAATAEGAELALVCKSEGGRLVALERAALLEGALAAVEREAVWVRAAGGESLRLPFAPGPVAEVLAGLTRGDELALLTDGAERPKARAVVERRLELGPGDPDWDQRWKLAVHLKDIHLERGMHCADCHFSSDAHGDGALYGELRAATTIKCEDCHGSVTGLATLRTSGNGGRTAKDRDLRLLKAPGNRDRFEWQRPDPDAEGGWTRWEVENPKEAKYARGARLVQRSALYPELQWEVPQVLHAVDPGQDELVEEGVTFRGRSRYNPLAQVAKTMRKDGSWGAAPAPTRWGGAPGPECERLAHAPKTMECYSCHTSWMTSCFGCHLDMKANWRRPALHNEGEFPRRSPFLSAGPKAHGFPVGQHPEEYQRNWTSYSFQTLRTDFFMLGKDGDVSGGRFVPVRSACAVTVGSQNANRENVYSQQQTISAEGFSGTAFSPHFPHTVRTREARQCTDCHLSAANDNNWRIAQTLMLGTNAANFLGRYVYVAEGAGGLDAVVVTERSEPQAVIGSRLHEVAYPEQHAAHVARERRLTEAYHHAAFSLGGLALPGGDEEVRSIQLRGEYLYTANGKGGLRVYDVAQIDQKGFSERIVSAPVSPLGQRLYVKTKDATSVKAPSTQGVDPTRNAQRLDRPQNREQQVHLSYAFLYVTDREEGLILVGAGTLLDGDPTNNFLERAVTFNPDGALTGAEDCVVAGTKVLVACKQGVVVVDVDDPLHPKVVARSAPGALKGARALEVQLDYAFVCDADGVKVLDLAGLWRGRPQEGERTLPSVGAYTDSSKLPEARSIYVSRSYGYVAGGPAGLVVLDLERPRQPRFVWSWNDDGRVHANDVKVGFTNASMYAYVASGGGRGESGLAVLQLTGATSAEDPYAVSAAYGKNPRPSPRLVARYRTSSPALAISEGVDRDRAVDEAGHQTGVFGRIGSRPFTAEEMRRLLSFSEGPHAGEDLRVPPLRPRPAAMGERERAARRREVEERFGAAPFSRLDGEDRPAVEWPGVKKKKKKPKKKAEDEGEGEGEGGGGEGD
ncbi:MAG: hypothetical protein AB7N76_29365 [Planctomycetota bacterium]